MKKELEKITLMNVDSLLRKIDSDEKRQGYFEYFINEYRHNIYNHKYGYQEALRYAYHNLEDCINGGLKNGDP